MPLLLFITDAEHNNSSDQLLFYTAITAVTFNPKVYLKLITTLFFTTLTNNAKPWQTHRQINRTKIPRNERKKEKFRSFTAKFATTEVRKKEKSTFESLIYYSKRILTFPEVKDDDTAFKHKNKRGKGKSPEQKNQNP